MNSLSWPLMTAAFGSITLLWNQIRSFFAKISSFMIVRAELDGFAAELLLSHCYENYKKHSLGDKRYSVVLRFIRPKSYYGMVPFENTSKNIMFTNGLRPLFLTLPVDKEGELSGSSIKISFLRGTFDIDTILINSSNYHNDKHHSESKESSRYYVKKVFGRSTKRSRSGREDSKEANDAPIASKDETRSIGVDNNRYLGLTKADIGAPQSETPFNNLAYPKHIKDFETEIRRWRKSEHWHKNKNIPWRFGAGLFGPPGTGKTSFVRATAQEFDMPIHIYDLTTMSNDELVKEWGNTLNASPCIVLFEDIDRIFDKDKNIKSADKESSLTLDCLLNCINGIEPAEGILVFVTANDMNKLDPALGVPDKDGRSTRPGRLDRAVYFGPLDEEGRVEIAKRILSDCPEFINETVLLGDKETGAQFENRCAKIALEHYWGSPKVYRQEELSS